MNKNEIVTILNDWNFWKVDLESGIPREDYLEQLKKLLSTNQIVVITGPRRAGKSFLMRQLAKQLMEKGTPKNEILIVNFEDPRWPKLSAVLLQKIYETYLEFLQPKAKPVIFLDEIQEVEEWEKWVRTVHELNKARMILSGSNAKLLSQELATLLTGRHVKGTVFPLSFGEYLLFHGIKITDPLDLIARRIPIAASLKNYLAEGSFPHVVLSPEKLPILLNYFEDILNKDLVRRFKIRKTESLKSLARFYLNNPASLTTFSSVEKFLKISADTVEKFSGFFEEAYLFFFLKRFSFKLKEREKSPRKVYPIDTGLTKAIGTSFSQNSGHLAETLVFLELLRKKSRDPSIDFFYWKDAKHREVDFVVKKNLKVTELIQVCLNLERPQTKERELEALCLSLKEFNLKSGVVITEDFEATEKRESYEIIFVPLWRWLLQKS